MSKVSKVSAAVFIQMSAVEDSKKMFNLEIHV